MQPWTPLEQRYGFRVPALYRTLLTQGHLSLPWENYLVFTDFEWLTPEAAATFEFMDGMIQNEGGFAPFAISGRHDDWSWRLDWATDDGEPPVVYCEWGGPHGTGYAPDFPSFLYRRALEEFAGYLDPESPNGFADLQRTVRILQPHLPAAWGQKLVELASIDRSHWQTDQYGSQFILPKPELESIIAAELAFPHLNEKFIIDPEYAKRFGSRG